MMRFNLHRKVLGPVLLGCFLVLFAGAGAFSQETDEEEFTQSAKPGSDPAKQTDPIELFNRAQAAHEKGDLDAALALYAKALVELPEFPEAEYQMGTIFEKTGSIDKAEAAYRRAIDHRRDWTLPMAALGSILVHKREFSEAELILNKAIRIDPMNFPAYNALTELYIRTKVPVEKMRALLSNLQYLTTKSKVPASIWASRAAAERALGDTKIAKESVSRALAIDDGNNAALAERVEILLIEGDSAGAEVTATALLSLIPDSKTAKILLARSYLANRRIEDAVSVLESIEQPETDVTLLLSTIKSSSDESIEDLEKILASEPENVAVLGRLCGMTRTVDPEKSLRFCRMALQLDRSNLGHAIGIGAALVQQHRYGEAVTVFRQLLTKAPENYTIRANLATALFQLENYEEAKIEYQWITERDPEQTVAYYFLAIAFDKLHYYRYSLANYQQFLRLADGEKFALEIEKVNLRLPILNKLLKEGKGKK